MREEYRPPEWYPVSEQPPPAGTLVEARVRLGATRSIILNLICSSSAVWVNGTTGDPLPDGWQPIEWRHPASAAADSGRSAEPTDPRYSSMPRRA